MVIATKTRTAAQCYLWATCAAFLGLSPKQRLPSGEKRDMAIWPTWGGAPWDRASSRHWWSTEKVSDTRFNMLTVGTWERKDTQDGALWWVYLDKRGFSFWHRIRRWSCRRWSWWVCFIHLRRVFEDWENRTGLMKTTSSNWHAAFSTVSTLKLVVIKGYFTSSNSWQPRILQSET